MATGRYLADPPPHRLSRQPRAVWAPASTLRHVHRLCFRHSYDDRTISPTRAADPHHEPGHRRPRSARLNMLCARAPLPAASLEGWPLAARPQRQRVDPALRPPHHALSCSPSPDERRCVPPCSHGSHLVCVVLLAVTTPLTAECTNSVGRVDLRAQAADARSARRAERTRSARESGRCSESGSHGPRSSGPARGRYSMTWVSLVTGGGHRAGA